MENLEQENLELRKDVTALKAGMVNLTALMESLVAAQNQPPLAQPQQTTFASKGPSVPVCYSSYCCTKLYASCLPTGNARKFHAKRLQS